MNQQFRIGGLELAVARAGNLTSGRDIVCRIEKEMADRFILTYHYTQHQNPVTVYSYGVIHEGELVSALTYAISPNYNLNRICDPSLDGKYKTIELNRMVSIGTSEYPLSKFVSITLRDLMRHGNYIVVSYADSSVGHQGYIYQACNFIYTGTTKGSWQWHDSQNPKRHGRKVCAPDNATELAKGKKTAGDSKVWSGEKHRYIYLCVGNKALRRKISQTLKFETLPYPKGRERNYVISGGEAVWTDRQNPKI